MNVGVICKGNVVTGSIQNELRMESALRPVIEGCQPGPGLQAERRAPAALARDAGPQPGDRKLPAVTPKRTRHGCLVLWQLLFGD
jgi:hypothetical protein